MNVERQSGVYEIVCIESGNKYVGHANNLAGRFRQHKFKLRGNNHHTPHLQSAWNRYGEGAFIFKSLIVCSRQDALEYEQKLLNTKEYIYNVNPVATGGGIKGVKRTEAFKDNLRRMLKGIKKSPEVSKRIRTGRDAVDHNRKFRFSKDGDVFIGTYEQWMVHTGIVMSFSLIAKRFNSRNKYRGWIQTKIGGRT